MIKPPQVIFLDAVGTLFGVQGSVGEIYAQIALEFGVVANTQALNRAFIYNFQNSPRMAFPNVELAQIPNYEYQWWRAIAYASFLQIGVVEQFADFEQFFRRLYDYFATSAPWFVYADVEPALSNWQDQGIKLGIISNFDTRLHSVLQALNLAQFFTSVTISTEVGAAKPDPKIFTHSLSKYNFPHASAWHIGDSLSEDYEGAQNAAIRGIWLHRSDSQNYAKEQQNKSETSIVSISHLGELLY